MRTLLVSLLVIMTHFSYGQMTRVRGKVIEKLNGEAVPFANVIFPGTGIGTITNMDGSFSIQATQKVDSIQVSYLGFLSKSVAIVQGEDQYLTVELEVSSMNLAEVEVIGDTEEKEKVNPAHAILKNISKRKKANQPDRISAYETRLYEKVEFDANNIDSAFMARKIFQPIDFVFDYLDTSEVNGKTYLPVFITESVYDKYYRKSPKLEKQVLKANKAAGFDKDSGVDEFVKALYVNYNFYDNFIVILDKSFVSPISGGGLLSYKYYLTDSAFIDDQWCYNIHFIPKRKKELTFKGDFWVADSTWAIKKFDMVIAGDANINWISTMHLKREYDLYNDSVWMIGMDYIMMDFALNKGKDTKGVYGKKTSYYRDYVLNLVRPDKFYSDLALNREEVDKNRHDLEYWNEIREEQLTGQEEDIYAMVDSLNGIPMFQTYVTAIEYIASGYWEFDGYDLGRFVETFAYNPIEGFRMRFGGRTYFSQNDPWRVYGHVAYGTKDQRLKYRLGVKWLFPTKKRQEMGVFYKYDIEQLGQKYTNTATSANNLLSSLLTREPMDKLSLVEEFRLYYEPWPIENFRIHMELNRRAIYDAGALNFQFYKDDVRNDTLNEIRTSEAIVEFVYQPGKSYLNYGVDLLDIYTPHPTYILSFTQGFDGVLGSDYTYSKIYAGYTKPILIPLLGKSVVAIEAGKTFGTVPYPLLEIIRGNNTYGYAQYSFNMMGFLEFVSDQYVQVFYEHHFLGFFLNKVPLFRRLNWREVATARGVYGTISEANLALSEQYVQAPSKGYYEASLGIENIFRILRVDAVWRFSYLDNPGASQLGVRVDLAIRF